ncbi:MAG: M48 metallopeptidase family protein [Actinomycetota bacterium]
MFASPVSPNPAAPAVQAVEIRRSARRKRTISARLENGTMILYLPAATSAAEEAEWVEKMRGRIEAQLRRDRINSSGDLERRAHELNNRYFEGRLTFKSISYVTNQARRFGSCSVQEATIRISHTLANMPGWVRDYVIVHELAHLIEPNHSSRFWQLVERYPLSERARGFLIAKGMESSARSSSTGNAHSEPEGGNTCL